METLHYIFNHTNPAQWALLVIAAAAVCMSLYVPLMRLYFLAAGKLRPLFKRIQTYLERREIEGILREVYYGQAGNGVVVNLMVFGWFFGLLAALAVFMLFIL